jgi:hypothetical protein
LTAWYLFRSCFAFPFDSRAGDYRNGTNLNHAERPQRVILYPARLPLLRIVFKIRVTLTRQRTICACRLLPINYYFTPANFEIDLATRTVSIRSSWYARSQRPDIYRIPAARRLYFRPSEKIAQPVKPASKHLGLRISSANDLAMLYGYAIASRFAQRARRNSSIANHELIDSLNAS